jgi:hypothetical protein
MSGPAPNIFQILHVCTRQPIKSLLHQIPYILTSHLSVDRRSFQLKNRGYILLSGQRYRMMVLWELTYGGIMAIVGNSEEIGITAYPNAPAATLNIIRLHPALNFEFRRNTSAYQCLNCGTVWPNLTSLKVIIEFA